MQESSHTNRVVGAWARSEVEAKCPRCGYDLAGVVESWQGTCPLEGMCSECGLNLRWAEVLNPLLTVPPWSFEHALVRRWSRLLSTAARSLWPLRFWSHLRLEHPIRWRRLGTFAASVLLMAHGLFTVSTIALAAWSMARGPWRLGNWPTPAWSARAGPGSVDVEVLLRVAAWPYSNPLAPGPMGPWLLVVALWAVVTPAAFLLLPATFRRCRVRRAHLARGLVYGATPIVFLVLTWVCLGFGAFAAVLAGPRTTAGFPLVAVGRGLRGALESPSAFLAVSTALLAATWYLIARRYLRLPHAALVAAATLVASGLLSFLLALALDWNDLASRLI
jgi:hypothetical protein